MMDAPATPTPPRRRFTLLDGMILVGSAALGLAATRWSDPEAEWWDDLRATASNFAWDVDLFDEIVPEMMLFAMPSAVATTLGVLALRLRQPRPRWRRLARHPGLVACLAPALAWAVAAAFAFVTMIGSVSQRRVTAAGTPVQCDRVDWLLSFTICAAALGGFGVVVAWATQLLVGRWRPEPTWPDRLGRLVGVGWIVMALAGMYAFRNLGL